MGMIACFRKVSSSELQQLLDNPESLSEKLFNEENESNEYDLDKAWHAIHYMLNGSLWEISSNAGALIMGGQPISDEDVGYGPARYFKATEVKEIFDEFSKVSEENLFSNFESMLAQGSEVYPGFEDSPVDREYIKDYFQGLKKFYEKTVKDNDCLIAYLA